MFVNEVPPGPKDTTNVQKEEDVKPQEGKTVPGVNISELINPNPQMIQKGKDLYNMNCSSCHGPQGNGDGPAGGSLNPKPRNFHATEGWINGREIKGMYKTLQEGIPNSAMASFNYLPPMDRFSIIFYIRSLAGNFPPVSQNDLQDLDKQYNLSAGQKASSQIPVKTAMEKISSEASVRVHKAYAVLEKIQSVPSSDSGSVIFDRVSRDKFEAVYLLSENTRWQTDLNYFIRTVYSGVNNN
jgi:mono/diheme cytochrome c family protein